MQSRPEKNYYELLGFTPEQIAKKDLITMKDIRSAYRVKAVLVHPDKNTAANAEEQFKELSKAYVTLSDSTKRYVYDHPSFKLFDINLKKQEEATEASIQKAKEAEERIRQLNKAYQNLYGLGGMAKKTIAALVALESVALITAVATIGAAIGVVAYLPGLAVMWAAPKWLGRKIGDEKLFESIAEKALLGFVIAPLIIAAVPVLGVVAGVSGSRQNYKEWAVRGLSAAGYVLLAMTMLGVTAGLLAAYPPAGAAALLGVGGKIATALGMGSYSAGAYSFCLGAIVAGATSVACSVASQVKNCVSSCFSAINNYFSSTKPQVETVPSLAVILREQDPASPLSSQAYAFQAMKESSPRSEASPAVASLAPAQSVSPKSLDSRSLFRSSSLSRQDLGAPYRNLTVNTEQGQSSLRVV